MQYGQHIYILTELGETKVRGMKTGLSNRVQMWHKPEWKAVISRHVKNNKGDCLLFKLRLMCNVLYICICVCVCVNVQSWRRYSPWDASTSLFARCMKNARPCCIRPAFLWNFRVKPWATIWAVGACAGHSATLTEACNYAFFCE
jgi:hypothetical protein